MLLSGALLALFLTGFWLYCLTDAMLTPPADCRGMSKRAWIVVIIGTFIGGAIAWLVVRPPARSSSLPPYGDPDRPRGSRGALAPRGLRGWDERWTAADDAVARHPAGRARAANAGPAAAKGPDDDLDFLRALDRVIRGNSRGGGEA